jgi:hypothetical protein
MKMNRRALALASVALLAFGMNCKDGNDITTETNLYTRLGRLKGAVAAHASTMEKQWWLPTQA